MILRCKACDRVLETRDNDTYCRKCIVASEDVDMSFDSLYYQNHLKHNKELTLQLFISSVEREELKRLDII